MVVKAYVAKSPNGPSTQVQVVWKRGRRVLGSRYVGTSGDPAGVALLEARAWEIAHEGMEPLWGSGQEVDAGGLGAGERGAADGAAGARVVRSYSGLLWQALVGVWEVLGFDEAVGDQAFRALVLARVVEPTSKADSARVLADLGAWGPSRRTVFRCLDRCQERGYRQSLAAACWRRAGTDAHLLLYDCTTLHFEIDEEDALRRVGFSKERRIDPQIVVGLLVDQDGFPLMVDSFRGNIGEVETILPVLEAFKAAQQVERMTVVADAAMLSDDNLDKVEDAELDFIVGARIDRTPFQVLKHRKEHPGQELEDGQVFVQPLDAGTKKKPRSRTVVYQWRKARAARDLRTIDKQVSKAQQVVDGVRQPQKARFLDLKGAEPALKQDLVDSARDRAGIKGYVTSLPLVGTPKGQEEPERAIDPLLVISHYHQLWEVERSFRMSKHDLRARPIWHQDTQAIEAHLTIVFAALAVARTIQKATGATIRRFVKTLLPLRAADITIAGQAMTIPPLISDDAQELLAALAAGSRATSAAAPQVATGPGVT